MWSRVIMHKEIISGQKIYLRELVDEDVTERYLNWFRDDEVTKFLEAKNLTRKDVIEYIKNGRSTGDYFMHAVCLIENKIHIGNLKVGPIDYKHMISDLVTVIGDKNYWKYGIATEAIRLGISIAFEKFNLRKLSAGMYSDNIGSYKSYIKAGFVEEARLKGQYILNGKVMDRICVGCFNPKYFPKDIDYL